MQVILIFPPVHGVAVCLAVLVVLVVCWYAAKLWMLFIVELFVGGVDRIDDPNRRHQSVVMTNINDLSAKASALPAFIVTIVQKVAAPIMAGALRATRAKRHMDGSTLGLVAGRHGSWRVHSHS